MCNDPALLNLERGTKTHVGYNQHSLPDKHNLSTVQRVRYATHPPLLLSDMGSPGLFERRSPLLSVW
jgi:hypothetical protein